MKLFCTAVTILVSALFNVDAADFSWVTPPPSNWAKGKMLKEVAEESIWEIVHTKVGYAMVLLASSGAVEVSADQAELLTGRILTPAKGMLLVLVRCQFGNGGTGKYFVSLTPEGESILVSHVSLGEPGKLTPSAVLIQTRRVPTTVFASTSFAR